MNKLKNNFLDLVLFVLYHIFILASSFLLLVVYTGDTSNLSFDELGRRLLAKQAEATSSQEVSATKSMVKKIIGTVTVKERNLVERPAREGEELITGSIIQTGARSAALLTFGNNYTSTFRLGSNSTVSIDDLMVRGPDQKSEKSLFNLIKGAVTFLVTEKKRPVDISVKTKFAVFGVRGTTFSVLTDGTDQSVLVVKEGIVQSENFTTNNKRANAAGSSLVVHISGTEKVFALPETINLFDWDFESLNHELPDLSHVLDSIGNPDLNQVTDSTPPSSNESLDQTLKIEVEAFKAYNEDLTAQIENSDQYLKSLQYEFDEEIPKINTDISCLRQSKSPCDLYSENLLMKRGFPRTFGSPSLIKMILADLQKYVEEKESKITEAKNENLKLRDLLKARMDLLSSIESYPQDNIPTQEIIPKLRNPELKMGSK